uniref:Putative ovule protein n=1 Tax=Solanum chacoense TaxID=4108 RepID=A0A0V0GQK9_SOLCH
MKTSNISRFKLMRDFKLVENEIAIERQTLIQKSTIILTINIYNQNGILVGPICDVPHPIKKERAVSSMHIIIIKR